MPRRTYRIGVVAALGVLLVCTWSPSVRAKDKPMKMALFLAAPERDGFVDLDHGIADSSKDLVTAFWRMAEVRLVKSRREAELVLTISGRGVASQAIGDQAMVFPIGVGVIASTTPVFQNDYWLSTVLEVSPTYQKAFIGRSSHTAPTSMGAWGVCAKMVAADVQAWIAANHVQLDGVRWLKTHGRR